MASLAYNEAAKKIADGTLDLLVDTIKVMIVNSTYTPNRDDHFVCSGSGSSDAGDAEITATNYTRGFGGAGRKTLASKTLTTDDTNDRAEFDAADVTWTNLGNGSNDTIVGLVLIKEITDDAASIVIAYIDIADTTTDGTNFVQTWDAQGIIQWGTA